MSVPLPTPEPINLERPSASEVLALSRGVVSAVSGDDGLSEIQGESQPCGAAPPWAAAIRSRQCSISARSSSSLMPPWRSALVWPWPMISSPRAAQAATSSGAWS